MMLLVKRALAVAILASMPGVAMAETTRDRQERACQADAYKFCKDAIPDEDKIAACMGEHRAQLSVNCGILYDAGGK